MLNKTKQSKCMYCNSTTFGRGCLYSPHKIHVHLDQPTRCIYCNSLSLGPGCLYNPFGKNHIRGVEFNNMIKENVHNSFSAGLFLSRLIQDVKDIPAYKLGLIDEQFNRLKIPETIDEKRAFRLLDVYIFRLRRSLGESKIKLLNSALIIELLSKPLKENVFNVTEYENEVKLQRRIADLVNEYKIIIAEALNTNVQLDRIEGMFIENLISDEQKEHL